MPGWGVVATALGLVVAQGSGAALPAIDGEARATATWRAWSGPDGQSGRQIFAPLEGVLSFPIGAAEFDLTLKTGFVAAAYEGYGFEGSVETWTDTVVGLNFGFPDAFATEGLRPFLVLDVNLPTGQATLTGLEKLALMDPDLADLVRYGEGLNFNIGAGAAYALDAAWVVTLAAGYNSRGAYRPDGDTGLRYEPGDQWTALATLDYAEGAVAGTLSVKYTGESMGRLDGADYFDPGDNLEASLTLAYAPDAASAIQLLVAYSRSDRNRYLNFFTGVIEAEAANGNGPVWAANLVYSRALGEGLVGSAYGTWKRRDANDFDPVNDLFIPARTQWSLGLGIEAELSPSTSLRLDASGGRLSDEATVFTGASQSYDTWSVSAGLVAAF